MAKGSVADIVQQYGNLRGLFLRRSDFDALAAQNLDGLQHQMHGTEGVVKAGMVGPRVDQRAEP